MRSNTYLLRPVLLLLAQLVAPPLQQGPIRLPQVNPGLEREAPRSSPKPEPGVEVGPAEAEPFQPKAPAPTQAPAALSSLPDIRGLTIYSRKQLQSILSGCIHQPDSKPRLEGCAETLTARLTADGYINTRVYVRSEPTPGHLEVIEGRLVEIRVRGSDTELNRRVARLIRSLQGRILHLPTLELNLQLLRQVPGVKQARGNLTRLGSDPSQASLSLSLAGGSPRWQGDLSIRNDGSDGSGEARVVASLAKPGALRSGDILLVYGEIDGDDTAKLGASINSLTYTLPLSESINLTGALGYSNRTMIELPEPANGLSTAQLQALGQMEWVFSESLTHRWSTFLGISGNWSRTLFNGSSLPPGTPEIIENPTTGYLRIGLNSSQQSLNMSWGSTAYLLAGVPGFSPEQQQQQWQLAGINPGNATAVGGLVSTTWAPATRWQISTRLAGQWAFSPLLPAMRFTLGSDVGLRGLPGQLISGDSGWLAVTEAGWTFWKKNNNALQLAPFIGAGGINISVQDFNFSDTVGSGGLLVRWLTGQNWLFELGWVQQFSTDNNPGPWQSWVLDDGLYAKAQFRF